MAKPIHHNTDSALMTAGWETAKGGIVGALVALAIGAAVVGGIFAAFGAPALVTGIAAAIGAGVTGIYGLTFGTVAGGLIGMVRGGSRVSRENESFRDRVEHRGQMHAAHRNTAEMAGMQKGYMMGFQEGQQYIVTQLQHAQEQMLVEQAAQAKAPEGGFAEKCAAKASCHAEAVVKGREAQAAAGPQVA